MGWTRVLCLRQESNALSPLQDLYIHNMSPICIRGGKEHAPSNNDVSTYFGDIKHIQVWLRGRDHTLRASPCPVALGHVHLEGELYSPKGPVIPSLFFFFFFFVNLSLLLFFWLFFLFFLLSLDDCLRQSFPCPFLADHLRLLGYRSGLPRNPPGRWRSSD